MVHWMIYAIKHLACGYVCYLDPIHGQCKPLLWLNKIRPRINVEARDILGTNNFLFVHGVCLDLWYT